MNLVIDDCVQVYQPKKDGSKTVKAPEDLGRILLKGEFDALLLFLSSCNLSFAPAFDLFVSRFFDVRATWLMGSLGFVGDNITLVSPAQSS